MSKLFIDLYYFVKSSFLKNRNSKRCYLIYTFDTNWYKPQLEAQVPAENQDHKEQIIFLSNAKFFTVIINIFLGQKPS